ARISRLLDPRRRAQTVAGRRREGIKEGVWIGGPSPFSSDDEAGKRAVRDWLVLLETAARARSFRRSGGVHGPRHSPWSEERNGEVVHLRDPRRGSHRHYSARALSGQGSQGNRHSGGRQGGPPHLDSPLGLQL